MQVKWTRHAGHRWRRRDELISDVLLWAPSHGRAKARRPARTYNSSVPIQDVSLKTYRERWTIEKGGGIGSGRSVLMVWHDGDDGACGCLCVLLTNLLVEFFFVILECPVFIFFTQSWNILNILSIFIVPVVFLGSFSFRWSSVCFLFLSNFVSCRCFFICPSSIISHPGFVILFGFFGESTYFITDKFCSSVNELVEFCDVFCRNSL